MTMRVTGPGWARALALAPLVLAGALLGACGGDGDDEELAIQGREYAFEGAPTTLSAGTYTFGFENAGAEFHEMILLRLPDGMTVDQALALPEEEADELLFGGAHGVLLAAPGSRSGASLRSELVPGAYALVCSFPSPDGVPHVALGMVSALTVTE